MSAPNLTPYQARRLHRENEKLKERVKELESVIAGNVEIGTGEFDLAGELSDDGDLVLTMTRGFIQLTMHLKRDDSLLIAEHILKVFGVSNE